MEAAVIAAIIGAVVSLATGVANVVSTNSRNQQAREYDENMLRLQNQWSVDQWNKTNEYNAPKEQVSRLYEAGLNPLYYGLDGSSAQAFQSAQPLGWNPQALDFTSFANIGDIISDVPMKQKQLELAEANIRNIDADTAKKRSETDFQTIMNEIAERTKEYKIEGERLANELTRKQLAKIDKEMDKIQQDIKESIAREESEWVKQSLMESEETLNRAKAYEIVEMLPYNKDLAKAKTDHEKAAAGLCWAQAAVQKDLLKEGYAKKICDELQSKIDLNEAKITEQELDNALLELEKNIKNGEPNDLAKWFNDHPWAKAAAGPVAFLSGDVFKVANTISESCGKILGPILGVAAGAAAGGAAGSARAVSRVSNSAAKAGYRSTSRQY